MLVIGVVHFSFAGHVESGETYEEGLYKEAQEEVGLDLTVIAFKEIGVFNQHKHNVHCFQKVYEIKSNSAPEYNPGDFSGYQWLLPEEIIQ
jgi:ADP-ribose pyrophosphatase YjhB (NUDIX family)